MVPVATPASPPTPQIPPGYTLVPTANAMTTAQAAPTPDSPPLGKGQFRVGGVTINLGGFVELDGIYRSNNENADFISNWSGIPMRNTPQAHESEFGMTARQSRVSMLVQGSIDPAQNLSAY